MLSAKEQALLGEEQRIYFRDQLRAARAVALRDSEEFHDILYALEQLGRYLFREKVTNWKLSKSAKHPPVGTLGNYKKYIVEIAKQSPLAEEIPLHWPERHMPLDRLYVLVSDARNDAMHQGVFARYTTGHAVTLAIVLEDGLMSEQEEGQLGTVADFMVRNPICAQPWYPISFIRQIMLENAFSCVPVWTEGAKGQGWHLISDQAIASYLRAGTRDERTVRLSTALKDAKELHLEFCTPIPPDTRINAALQSSKGLPLLVARNHDMQGADSLLGILTPFDLL